MRRLCVGPRGESNLDKRYQVFISSTFVDLIDERQAVLKAVLELDHMPAGMELFPAVDDTAWNLIKTVIDASDYYVLILGGRYGSLHPDGLGYTEMEYDYAFAQKKPVIALLHGSPDQIPRGKTETDEAAWQRLSRFRKKVQERHTCQFWTTAQDLKSGVIVSLTSTIKRHPAVGWLRADTVPTGARVEDVLALRERVAELEGELRTASTGPAAGTEDLLQGADKHEIQVQIETHSHYYDEVVTYTWDEIFAAVAPALLNEATDAALRKSLKDLASKDGRAQLEAVPHEGRILRGKVEESEIDTCIIQFRALGLIQESQRRRSVTDSGKYWSLTPYGDHKLVQLRAMKKPRTE